MDAEAKDGRRLQPRIADVVRVADPRDRPAGDVAAMLHVRVDVREDLARVVFVGEAVDHRHPRVFSEAFDDGLLERADHHDVDHARDHPRDVLDRLAARQLRVAAIQVDRDAAELVHARLERHAGARGRFFEHHRQCAVAQRLVEFVALESLLDPLRAGEQVVELVAREIAELQEMPGRRDHRRGHRKRKCALRGRSVRTSRQQSKILARAFRPAVRRPGRQCGNVPGGGAGIDDVCSEGFPTSTRMSIKPSRHACSRSESTAASASSPVRSIPPTPYARLRP